MPKRLIDLRDELPLLDIASYGRAFHPTPARREHIALTVRRVPEVMVRVTGGARTLAGVRKHMSYVGREGKLGLETDTGERLDGEGFARKLTEDWDLDIDAHPRQTERAIRVRKPPKLVHNVFFSMPPGAPPEKVLQAVRNLALNEWQLKHRYAMVLHTDQDHPHVHVVIKAVSEQGKRLNIRKATLRSWRKQFAANLRELNVAANATERAVRGQTRTHKSSGVYRAAQRQDSTHMRERQAQVLREAEQPGRPADPGHAEMHRTRQVVVGGWRDVESRLRDRGDHELADDVRTFVDRMPPVQTEKALLAERVLGRTRSRWIDPLDRTR
jgi:hypothetical protein